MDNKAIYIALIYALLQATNAKEAEPALSFEDGPLSIFVDAGKEIETFLSLAKKIEKTQSLIESALERMSAEIKTLAERTTADAKATEEKFTQRITAEAKVIAERCNQRMSAEIKAIDERWNVKLSEMSRQQTQSISGKVTVLKQNVNDTRKQPPKSADVEIPHKRPADRACVKISENLRSIEAIDIIPFPSLPYYFKLSTANDEFSEYCVGALIDKRFVLTLADYLTTHAFRKIQLPHNSEKIGIKAIHIHANFSKAATRSNFGLVELDSAVNYTRYFYPVCLYTSQSNPKSEFIHTDSEALIVANAECGKKYAASEVCAKDSRFACTMPGQSLYVQGKEFPKPQIFGIILESSCYPKPYWVGKVFEHLDFIESIVWPEAEN